MPFTTTISRLLYGGLTSTLPASPSAVSGRRRAAHPELVLAAGGSTDWGRPSLIAQLAYLVIGGQLLVYLGFNAGLSRWPSTRVYAWTFLVPVVAVVIQAFRGALPGVAATVGVAVVILGVAVVNHSRAEGSLVFEGHDQPVPAEEIGLPTAEAP